MTNKVVRIKTNSMAATVAETAAASDKLQKQIDQLRAWLERPYSPAPQKVDTRRK